MTDDIRAAAREQAAKVFIEPRVRDMLPVDYIAKGGRDGFQAGAVWAQAQLTPTREQIAEVMRNHQHDYCEECGFSNGCTCGWSSDGHAVCISEEDPIPSLSEHQADMILQLFSSPE